ncbi:MAG: hypothetical protein NT039_03745 [Candidatus Berkelbacteria bacterium]|nr:hypothetical protein [Candidatus Berkelbacteria bacterium]
MCEGNQKQVSPAVAAIVILIVFGVVLAVGWAIFYRPRPPAEQELAVKAIVGKSIVHPGKADTANCSVKAVGAEWCNTRGDAPSSPPITTYLVVDCEVTVHPLKGTADKVITFPPDKKDTDVRLYISLRSGDKEIGRVNIPMYYEHGGYQWRVRDVYVRAFTTPSG